MRQKERTDCHVNSHVMAVVNLFVEREAERTQLTHCVHITGACIFAAIRKSVQTISKRRNRKAR
jgi:hypothetical protein